MTHMEPLRDIGIDESVRESDSSRIQTASIASVRPSVLVVSYRVAADSGNAGGR